VRIRRPSPAMCVALIALFVALGGTGYAAMNLPRDSVGTAQLKDGAVTRSKISARARRALRGRRGTKGPAGPRGATGPVGPATGPAGGALAGSYPNPSLAAGAVHPGNLGGVPTARLTNSADQPWPNQLVVTPVSFDTELFDNAGMHDAAHPTRLTAPIDGIYLIGASATFGPGATSSRAINLVENGTTTLSRAFDFYSDTDYLPVETVTTTKLRAGDYVESDAARTSASGSISIVSSGPQFSPAFWMTWIAPAS
jgi:hypothetical protein